MSFKPGRRKDRGDAFAMLERSHARLQEQLEALLAAAGALNQNPADADARATVAEIAEFIDRSVTRHEQDEEQSLFPHLRVHAVLAPLLDRLEVEHRAHEKLHAQLRDVAAACARGRLDPTVLAELSDLAVTLSQLYLHHIEAEEIELFPAARIALPPATAAAIAADMQSRRGR
jgi:hemerythrin-like domain-containing protein